MKRIASCLFALALLLALPQAGHADQFTQIQNGPNTYWVPAAPANSSDPKDIANNAPQQSAPRQGYTAAPPPGYYYAPVPPPPAYAYYYGAPGPYYYAPRPRYYGPPVAASYYGGPHGSRVVIGIPGLFFGFHFH